MIRVGHFSFGLLWAIVLVWAGLSHANDVTFSCGLASIDTSTGVELFSDHAVESIVHLAGNRQ